MRPGSWPDTPVRTTTARAFLNGVERDVETVSLTSEMTADFALSGGGQDPVTDGTVRWPQRSVAASTIPQPFRRDDAGWPPVTGSSLVVEVGDGAGQWWRQVTGLVDSSSGSLDDPQVESAVIDYVDRLSAPVRRNPLLEAMPPHIAGQHVYRRVGLTAPHITNLLARAAGFYATPRNRPETLLSVPCMGSMWVELGKCVLAGQYLDDSHPVLVWQRTDYGVAAVNPDASYEYDPTAAVVLTVSLVDQPAGLGMAYAVSAGTDDLRGFVLRHTTDDLISVTLPASAGGAVITSLPRNGATRAAVQASASTTTGRLSVLLKLSDGRQVSTTSRHTDFDTPLEFSAARIVGAGAAGAMLIDPASVGLAALTDPVTAVFRFSPNLAALQAMPALTGQTALSLLVEQATAQGSSFWIDSQGCFRWADRGILEADPVRAVKSTDLTVDGFAWTDNLASVRKELVLKRRVPAVSRSFHDNVPLWQSSAQELVEDQSVEEWLAPDTDTDWILPDTLFVRVADTPGASLSYGSKMGAAYVDDDPNTPEQQTSSSVYEFAIETTRGTIKITQTVTGALPAGKRLATKIASDAINLPRSWRGSALPLLRGRGRVRWAEDSATYPTGGTGTGTLEHDVSWWVQTQVRLDGVRDWLLAKITDPAPTVSSVEIDPDPRLELGDKVTIRDDARTGLEFDLVITRIAQSWGGDKPSMALAGRVTRVASTRTITDPVSAWEAFVTSWKANA